MARKTVKIESYDLGEEFAKELNRLKVKKHKKSVITFLHSIPTSNRNVILFTFSCNVSDLYNMDQIPFIVKGNNDKDYIAKFHTKKLTGFVKSGKRGVAFCHDGF